MATPPVSFKVDITRYMTFERKNVRTAMRQGATLVRQEAKRLASTKQGPSAPGQPPARETGNLWRSIYGRASRRGYAFVAGTSAPHAHLLEMGTERMAARPLMPIALDNRRDEVIGLLQLAIGKGLVAIDGRPGSAPKAVEVG